MRYPLILLGLALGLAACDRDPFIVRRSPCPAVAIPHYAGDLTRFVPGAGRDESALDFTATLTTLRSTCTEDAANVNTVATYDVVALRRVPGPAREVRLPVFAAAVRAGSTLVSKEVGEVSIRFAEGQVRGSGSGQARSTIDRSEVGLSRDINRRITRERKAGEVDAALDPLSEPEVRDAVRRATFELLVGFQLSAPELAYNARK